MSIIKEYRLCMPMSVSEYERAQRYAIQKNCLEECKSGSPNKLRVVKNEKFTNRPDGLRQHTVKNYKFSVNLPLFIQSIIPSGYLELQEESWNYFPFIKTEYRMSNIFSLKMETKYVEQDIGQQENIFQLSPELLEKRIIEDLDFIYNPQSKDYKNVSNPEIYQSKLTNRGPLHSNWLPELRDEVIKKTLSNSKTKSFDYFCEYKLIQMERNYSYASTMIFSYIDDSFIRPLMLRIHRAVWCWQDEWIPLTLDDIYQMELRVAEETRENESTDATATTAAAASASATTSNNQVKTL